MAILYDAHIRQLDPQLQRSMEDLLQQIQTIASQVVATPQGTTAAPPSITALSVIAANGIFDIQIQDNSPVSRGINYFVEYSTTPGFSQPHAVDLGAARTYRATWGNETLYFRAFSQYPTSSPSGPVYFGPGNNPTAVVGGGSTGPAPQASTGSGTAPNNGQSGGAGFGYNPTRGRQDNVL